ncbi:hypothetical protein ACFPM7_08325 [Actinokineospora guangxiensis]|uniref:Uncharacterized protein n=1 Tax=Actinokineospora guangxiensis TaxID=1490288 RepID=A0ABW0EM85_9PSEU
MQRKDVEDDLSTVANFSAAGAGAIIGIGRVAAKRIFGGEPGVDRKNRVGMIVDAVALLLLVGAGAYTLEQATGQSFIKYLAPAVAIIPMVVVFPRSSLMAPRG